MKLYNELLEKHGKQNWWPVMTDNKFEICIGAILTQNTSWRNVEMALANMIKARTINPSKIASMPTKRLEKMIRPSGFFRQKAKRLKEFSKFVLSYGSFNKFLKNTTREDLLSVKGIGKETADSILLYACGKPFFVVDSYTRRLLSRNNMLDGKKEYDEIREIFESNIPRNIKLYKEFHALIVVNGKNKNRTLTD
ncbi:MAG: endonuclease III domain-containing protein [Candidatus Aenigmarchaeota archaeon]|nr:endonuclease III domain-containing protein [Candidatus Aenigmarchaeota archaeon]